MVAFKERVVEDRERKDWRLFEVTGHGLEGRLFLVVRKEGIGTCRLVHTDDKGLAHEVVLMEQSSRGGK